MNYSYALSNEQIQRFAPSVFAATPYHKQSDRYAFIPTNQIVDAMRSAGFLPVQVSQSRTRIEDKQGFTKHMLRFRSASSIGAQAIVGHTVLEAVLVNSHDGTSRYKLMAGLWRFVCANGMVVADSLLESINIRHTGNVIEEVIAGSNRILEVGPRVMNTVQSWQGLQLSAPEQRILAEEAHSLRFPVDEETGKANTLVTPEMLLAPRRREDSGNDLYTTFNRIQENSVKGVRTWNARQRVTSRAVKGIDGDIKLNRALWSLAEKMAELKGAN